MYWRHYVPGHQDSCAVGYLDPYHDGEAAQYFRYQGGAAFPDGLHGLRNEHHERHGEGFPLEAVVYQQAVFPQGIYESQLVMDILSYPALDTLREAQQLVWQEAEHESDQPAIKDHALDNLCQRLQEEMDQQLRNQLTVSEQPGTTYPVNRVIKIIGLVYGGNT